MTGPVAVSVVSLFKAYNLPCDESESDNAGLHNHKNIIINRPHF